MQLLIDCVEHFLAAAACGNELYNVQSTKASRGVLNKSTAFLFIMREQTDTLDWTAREYNQKFRVTFKRLRIK